MAHRHVMVAPAYKCGPGKSFPVRRNVLKQPSNVRTTPVPSRRFPQTVCLSRTPAARISLRSACSSAIFGFSGTSGAFSSSPFAPTATCGAGTRALSASISSGMSLRARRHWRPRYPAYVMVPSRKNSTAGWRSANVRPSRMPCSPPTAYAASFAARTSGAANEVSATPALCCTDEAAGTDEDDDDEGDDDDARHKDARGRHETTGREREGRSERAVSAMTGRLLCMAPVR
mmetsp:Transcript_8387/g.22359  ORF Transcript_8387/g.22359 Transcript_8387/m.22359 type:complete len:231 (-) Transcript_8387:101-793(-)